MVITNLKLMAISLFHYFFFLLLLLPAAIQTTSTCNISRCGHHGPAIHFPFRLQTKQPQNCGYKGFELYCNQNNQILLELPLSVKMVVKKIDYVSQSIHLYDPNNCLPKQLPNLNLSASPFHFITNSSTFSLFNCPPPRRDLPSMIPCLSVGDYQVYALDLYYHGELNNCVKIHNISSAPYEIFESGHQNELELTWMEPNCSKCEAQGKMCSWNSYNSTTAQHQLQCLPMPKTSKESSKKLFLVTGLVSGTILLALFIVALYCTYTSYKTKKDDQVKIETFLEDYKALKPSRYTFADIKKITNQFKEKLGEGDYGTVFKGELSSVIFVAVKVLKVSIGNGEEFIEEVGIMARIHHINVIRLVGFCADGNRRALIYEFLPNVSLDWFLFSENQKNIFLGWKKLHNIALGTAKGIEYLRQGCDHQILHFGIRPHNILLDHNFNPKIIADFCKLCSKEQSIVSMTTARGTMRYIAPEVFSRNFGNVSYKSDVYSFGMLLLEMVGGRKNIDTTVQNTSQTYFPEWIYNRLCQGEDLGIKFEEEEHSEIAKKLTIVGLWCIQWYPVDRPAMKTVVQMLERKVHTLSMPPNPFTSTIQSESQPSLQELFI